MLMKKKVLYIIALFVLFLSQSCVKEIEFVDSCLGEGEGWLYVNFGPQELIQVQTKSTQNYNSENAISNLYIFLFDDSGNKLYGKWLTSSSLLSSEANVMSSTDDCWYVANSSTAGTPTKGCFKIKASAGNNFKLYVITNLDSDMSRISSDLLSHSVATEADLLKFKLVLNQETVNRNINFPMLGSMTGVTIKAEQTNVLNSAVAPLKLDRIDSKVRFVFKTGTRPDAKGQRIRSFEARQWKVVNVPISSFLVPQTTDAAVVPADAATDQYEAYAPSFFETDWRNFEDYTTTTQEFSFYMLENRQTPKNDEFDSYQERSLQRKTASGLNQTVNVNYTSLHGENVDRSIRVFKNANDFSTYVLVTGRVEMDLVNDNAGQTLGADVQYLIHLGNWSSTISNTGGWADDTYTNVADFNTNRNHSYTYTVTVNSVDNIRVEVETGAQENQPGATGEVIIAKEEIALCDAHYVSKTMTFHAKNFVTVGGDGTVTSTADRLTWKVKTPFGEGAPKKINGIDIADSLDYKWVHFRLNKQSDNKSYYADKRRKYTQRVFESKAIPQANPEDDGTEGLYGYHNDGCMDIIHLVQYIKNQVELYTDYRNEVNRVFNAGGDPTTVVNKSDFDSGLMENGSRDPDGPKICVTAFVDEYYYEEHPITKRKSPTLWKYFVNQDDRTMHILCDSNSSTDLESTSTGSVITIQQHSIKSIFNTDPSYDVLQTAWGLECTDEFSDQVTVYNVGGGYTDSGKNTDNYNGRANSVFEWGLAPSGTTVSTITDLSDASWGTYINYEVPNEVPLMKDAYKSLRYFCMARNRDNDGDGIIERNEVRWYLASIQQLVGLFVGNGVVQQSARLYYRTPEQKASNDKNDWYQFVISSTHHSDSPSPIVIWGQEGLSTSSLSQSLGWASGVTAYGIRCVRNLGIDSDAPINEAPDDFLTKTENADGSVTFEATHLNAAALRDYTSTDLPYADEWSSANRLYKRFEVAPEYTDFSSTIPFTTFQADIDARGSYLSGYCPEGYRIPNQMELAMMNYYMGLTHDLYSRTYWSFGPYTGKYGPGGKSDNANNIGFMRISNGNLTVDTGTTTRYARCVKDIRMN